MQTHPVILFDGICNLCNGFVKYIIERDPGARFQFASLQSAAALTLLKKHGINATSNNSIILIDGNKVYRKSTAALQIAKSLKGISRLAYGFIIVPEFIRDAIYDLVARYRYTWFGKLNQCMVPTPGLQERFLK